MHAHKWGLSAEHRDYSNQFEREMDEWSRQPSVLTAQRAQHKHRCYTNEASDEPSFLAGEN